MYIEARKIHLIEEVLKENNEETLRELETVLKKSRQKAPKKKKKPSIYDFIGIVSRKDATEMREFIKETCETIHPDDWK
ncbi:MAG: hypothetical protein M3Y85_11540 [Bacteroidota bacterium]|nr:hypothetical protein [Bacteroidota bacterium]